jgi:hypothetical protein
MSCLRKQAEIDEPLTSAMAALPASASQAEQEKAKAMRKVVFIIFAREALIFLVHFS